MKHFFLETCVKKIIVAIDATWFCRTMQNTSAQSMIRRRERVDRHQTTRTSVREPRYRYSKHGRVAKAFPASEMMIARTMIQDTVAKLGLITIAGA